MESPTTNPMDPRTMNPKTKVGHPKSYPNCCCHCKVRLRINRPFGPFAPVVGLTKVRPITLVVVRVKLLLAFNNRNTVSGTVACKVSCLSTRPANRSRSGRFRSFSVAVSFSFHKVPMLISCSFSISKSPFLFFSFSLSFPQSCS